MTASPMESLYQEIILDHYRTPHHAGLRQPFEAEVHHVNPTCGDTITLRVHLDGDTVDDVSYDTQGCSISQASASVMADLVIGQLEPDEDVLEDAVAFAGVSRYPARVKCALLAWMAWKDAAAQAAAREGETA
jgi:nitrogen fixation NifU-like protein